MSKLPQLEQRIIDKIQEAKSNIHPAHNRIYTEVLRIEIEIIFTMSPIVGFEGVVLTIHLYSLSIIDAIIRSNSAIACFRISSSSLGFS